MKKTSLLILLIIGVMSSVSAQQLDQYRYVVVPEKYDFLKEENKYKLNALTAFLFEKYGFETFYKEQVPKETDPCEVLQAQVHNESNLFRSKVYVTLENCRNEVVFTSVTGSSSDKDYERSYQEALREAFSSVEDLNYQYTPSADLISAAPEPTETPAQVKADPVQQKEPEAVKVTPEVQEAQVFVNGSVTYRLVKTAPGFDLYKKGEEAKFASLIKSGGGENYLYASDNVSGNAFFDAKGNLVVEYLAPGSGQVVQVTYKLQAQ